MKRIFMIFALVAPVAAWAMKGPLDLSDYKTAGTPVINDSIDFIITEGLDEFYPSKKAEDSELKLFQKFSGIENDGTPFAIKTRYSFDEQNFTHIFYLDIIKGEETTHLLISKKRYDWDVKVYRLTESRVKKSSCTIL